MEKKLETILKGDAIILWPIIYYYEFLKFTEDINIKFIITMNYVHLIFMLINLLSV